MSPQRIHVAGCRIRETTGRTELWSVLLACGHRRLLRRGIREDQPEPSAVFCHLCTWAAAKEIE